MRIVTAVAYGAGRNDQRERKGGSAPENEQVYHRYVEIFISGNLSAPPEVVGVERYRE